MKPARKGDYAVVCTYHQSTAIHGASSSYQRFQFAIVSKTDREGKVTACIPTGQSAPLREWYQIWTIAKFDVELPTLWNEKPHQWDTINAATETLLKFKAA